MTRIVLGNVLVSLVVLVFGGGCQITNLKTEATVPAKHPDQPVTAAAFGDMYDMSDGALPANKGGSVTDYVSGDTWYTTWGANDTAWLIHDDGLGFNNKIGIFARSRLCRLDGHPGVSTGSFFGVNLNPGLLGQTLPHFKSKAEWRIGYSSSIHEQDGVLYMVRHNWSPPKELWPPVDASIIKSADGGVTWVNHLLPLHRENQELTNIFRLASKWLVFNPPLLAGFARPMTLA